MNQCGHQYKPCQIITSWNQCMVLREDFKGMNPDLASWCWRKGNFTEEEELAPFSQSGGPTPRLFHGFFFTTIAARRPPQQKAEKNRSYFQKQWLRGVAVAAMDQDSICDILFFILLVAIRSFLKHSHCHLAQTTWTDDKCCSPKLVWLQVFFYIGPV